VREGHTTTHEGWNVAPFGIELVTDAGCAWLGIRSCMVIEGADPDVRRHIGHRGVVAG